MKTCYGILLVVVLVVCGFLTASATERIWTGGGNGWADPNSWENGKPEKGDIAVIPGNVIARATDADLDLINELELIKLLGSSAGVNFDIAGEGKRVEIPINDNNSGRTGIGTIYKTGAGDLYLAKETGIYSYYCNVVVSNGYLRLPCAAGATRNFNYGTLSAWGDGILGVATADDAKYEGRSWANLMGDGVITNPSPYAATIYLRNTSTDNVPEFSGRFEAGEGSIFVTASDTGDAVYQNFTGTGSQNVGAVESWTNSVLGIADFGGVSGVNVHAGSTGTGLFVFAGMGGFKYLGNGQTSYANFTNGSKMTAAVLDGGAAGGLALAGSLRFENKNAATAQELVLAGDNAAECVVDCPVTLASKKTMDLVKRGTGTWHVKDNADRDYNGLVQVENGTLKVDSWTPVGTLCGLGKANASALKTLGYEIRLGTESTTGTVEYAGSSPVVCLENPRRVAVSGTGRIRATGASMSLTNIRPVGTDPATLVLDGAATGNRLTDVADGDSKLSVAKEGAGDWTLVGSLGFTGRIDVRGGTLELKSGYEWYKLSIRERYAKGASRLDVSRFGLFDASGVMQNADAAYADAKNDSPQMLEANEACLSLTTGDSSKITTQNGAVGKLFLDESGSSFWGSIDMRYGSSDRKNSPWLDDGDSWVSVVVRLSENANPVVGYDIGTRWAMDSAYLANVPQSWTLYGSVDGLSWEELHTVVSNRTWASDQAWLHEGKQYFKTPETQTNGNPWVISEPFVPAGATRLSGLDGVSVAAGATLKTDAPVVVRSLTIDTLGGGTLDGFAFPESGTLDVTGMEAKLAAKHVSITILPAGAAANLEKWSVTYNGRPVSRTIKITGTGIDLQPTGLLLIVR